jgi:hypothetical protein
VRVTHRSNAYSIRDGPQAVSMLIARGADGPSDNKFDVVNGCHAGIAGASRRLPRATGMPPSTQTDVIHGAFKRDTSQGRQRTSVHRKHAARLHALR